MAHDRTRYILSMALGKNEDLSLQKDTIDANLATLEPIAINTVDQGSNSSDYVLQELQPISHYLSAENVNQDFLKIEASCSISNNKVSSWLETINIDDVIIGPFDNTNSVQKDSSDIILAATESIRSTTTDAPLQMLGGDQASHKESVNSEDDYPPRIITQLSLTPSRNQVTIQLWSTSNNKRYPL
ncbi:uncharacterized protein LOC126748240 [Anthonomus grandis grandis]|uniref:uncharacterized protein LOC126748240 n=1 Tax=Anthonomus grandis grandis TaxID=2921223 RepID=UPI0021666178|nr:uncharacterized protein LOC126748240 [Anthonomus grandis grandis]